MDIEKELRDITIKKDGNKEMAFFYDNGDWNFSLGNPTNCVQLGEVNGEFEVDGDSLEKVINKMKLKLGM